MRDSRASLEYFDYLIQYKESTIRSQEFIIRSRDEIFNEALRDYVVASKIDLLVAYYSHGLELEKLKEKYLELIPDFSSYWTGAAYNMIISMLSFAVLFDIDQKNFSMLKDAAQRMKIGRRTKDWLVNFYLHSRFPEVHYEDDPFVFPKGYQDYRDIAASKSPKEELYRFAKSKWYLKQRGEAWWGSHKEATKRMPVYFGYWCFEVAAVAKILGIDDTDFQNIVYYPYDLAHFSEGEQKC